jgi:hypothetical protein
MWKDGAKTALENFGVTNLTSRSQNGHKMTWFYSVSG